MVRLRPRCKNLRKHQPKFTFVAAVWELWDLVNQSATKHTCQFVEFIHSCDGVLEATIFNPSEAILILSLSLILRIPSSGCYEAYKLSE